MKIPKPTRFRVVRECWNQDSKKRMMPGDIVSELSDFEISRNLAEGNIEIYSAPQIGKPAETQMAAPPEVRAASPQTGKPAEHDKKGLFSRRGRPKK